jgi:hypothetical protein
MNLDETIVTQADVVVVTIAVLIGIAGSFFSNPGIRTLRGRLEAAGPVGRCPARGIAVTVFRPDIGRSAPAYSGRDGMFCLNIPSGNYTVEVWCAPNGTEPPLVFHVEVKEARTDLPPIRLPSLSRSTRA